QYVADHDEGVVEVLLLLDARGLVREPGKDVLSADQDEDQHEESHRQEGYVALEQANDRPRPAGRGDALYGDEDHAGLRYGREEEPVEVQRLPRAILTGEGTDQEDEDADDGEYGADDRERARHRTR